MNNISAIPINKNSVEPRFTEVSNNPLDCPVNDFETLIDLILEG